VSDRVVVGEQGLQVRANGVAVPAGCDEHMRR
jgi:hypothetical protein